MSRAEVVPGTGMVRVEHADPYALRGYLRRETRRRAVLVRSDIHEVAPGRWGVWVTELRPRRRAWVRPVAIGGTVAGSVAGLAGLGWWLSAVMTAPILAAVDVVGPAALALLALACLALLTRGRRHGRCETTVIVRHRHR